MTFSPPRISLAIASSSERFPHCCSADSRSARMQFCGKAGDLPRQQDGMRARFASADDAIGKAHVQRFLRAHCRVR